MLPSLHFCVFANFPRFSSLVHALPLGVPLERSAVGQPIINAKRLRQDTGVQDRIVAGENFAAWQVQLA